MRPRAQVRSPIQTYAKLGGGSRINPTVCQIWMIPWHTCRSEAERNVTQPGRTSGKTPQSFRLSDGTELTADQFVFACGSWLGKALPDVIGDRVAPSRQHLLWRYARRFPLWRGTAGDSRWGVRQRRDRRCEHEHTRPSVYTLGTGGHVWFQEINQRLRRLEGTWIGRPDSNPPIPIPD